MVPAALAAGCAAIIGAGPSAATPLRTTPPPVTAAGCPELGPDRGPFPFPVGPAEVMVPGVPSSAAVCRYHGLNPPAEYRRLEASADLTDSSLRQLVSDLDSVGANVRPGVTTCLYDDAQDDLIIFSYQDGDPVYVTVQLLGCGIASNGTMRSMLHGLPDSAGERVLAQLAAEQPPSRFDTP